MTLAGSDTALECMSLLEKIDSLLFRHSQIRHENVACYIVRLGNIYIFNMIYFRGGVQNSLRDLLPESFVHDRDARRVISLSKFASDVVC